MDEDLRLNDLLEKERLLGICEQRAAALEQRIEYLELSLMHSHAEWSICKNKAWLLGRTLKEVLSKFKRGEKLDDFQIPGWMPSWWPGPGEADPVKEDTVIREVMRRSDMSNTRLRSDAGIGKSLTWVSFVTRGDKPAPEDVRTKMSLALGVPESELFDDSGYAKKIGKVGSPSPDPEGEGK
jgi:hypothetical protein